MTVRAHVLRAVRAPRPLMRGAALAGAALALTLGRAAALELSLPDVELPAGKSVQEPIKARDAQGLEALEMTVKFDGEAFVAGRVEPGPALANVLVDSKCVEGACKIAFAGPQPIGGDGDLLIIELRRKEGATGGSALGIADAKAWNGQSEPIAVTTRPGKIAPLGAAPQATAAASADERWFMVAMASSLVAALALLALIVRLWRESPASTAASPRMQPLPGADRTSARSAARAWPLAKTSARAVASRLRVRALNRQPIGKLET